MSMLLIVRDTAALCDLEKQLQGVREAQLRAARDGSRPAAAELEQAEARVIAEIKRKHYCLVTRLAFLPADQAEARSDEADYAGRQFIDAETSILDAHRRVLSLPFVGAPGFDDPDPQTPSAEGPG